PTRVFCVWQPGRRSKQQRLTVRIFRDRNEDGALASVEVQAEPATVGHIAGLGTKIPGDPVIEREHGGNLIPGHRAHRLGGLADAAAVDLLPILRDVREYPARIACKE